MPARPYCEKSSPLICAGISMTLSVPSEARSVVTMRWVSAGSLNTASVEDFVSISGSFGAFAASASPFASRAIASSRCLWTFGSTEPKAKPVGDEIYINQVLNNRFKVESKIGEGGFGAVYRGIQLATGRKVALKLLHPEMTKDENLVARFRREGMWRHQFRDSGRESASAATITCREAFIASADGRSPIAVLRGPDQRNYAAFLNRHRMLHKVAIFVVTDPS